MIGFGLLCGHLLGDYIVQNDWMAANKANPRPRGKVYYAVGAVPGNDAAFEAAVRRRDEECAYPSEVALAQTWSGWRLGHLACSIHCLLYTLAVWACSSWWMPWWGLAICFAAHWPLDRFRLAAWWMRNVAGQAFFASKEHPLFPWSVVVVDNTLHLLTLFVIALAAGVN